MNIDKIGFESSSSKGCSSSHYTFMKTNCCARVGVEDLELSEFYFDPSDLTKSVNLFEELTCPFCQSGSWELAPLNSYEVPGTEWNLVK
ncbi:Uncharacterised protein [BD1-7 clade bacterium]|uniref:Uncharacterized protein n=1 Tax=BD1-7 clade bacterium TaxID=2029982 RepID=A0A5S9PKK2_9GAMM|nr:Uncharacterised protein [BD1-7 clade bacterium]CAA0104284.1 Uncharacterised protein [BD1-7 clade bacterium]